MSTVKPLVIVPIISFVPYDELVETSNLNYIANLLSVNYSYKNSSNNSLAKYLGNIPEYLLDYNIIKNHNFSDYSKFYNKEIKQLVDKIYKSDFVFFNNYNINLY